MEIGVEFFKIPVDIVSLNKASLSLKYEVVKDGKIIMENSPSGRVIFEASVLREYLDFKYYSDIYYEAILDSIGKNNYFGGSKIIRNILTSKINNLKEYMDCLRSISTYLVDDYISTPMIYASRLGG